MDKSTILLILNLLLVAFAVLGFLFNLKGIKKSGLKLGFFVGAIIITTLITPLITKAVMTIQIPFDGTKQPISDIIINMVKDAPIVNELAAKGTNVEQLILNSPQLIGNLVVYMVLLLLVSFLCWIGYLITAHCLFKNDKKKKKNPITKDTPANVSATGNVSYVENKPKKKKFRLLGGLVGACHGVIFIVAFLLPIFGTVGIACDLIYEKEAPNIPATAQISMYSMPTLDASSSEVETEESEYTPFALFIQDKIPEEVLDIIDAADHSVIGSITHILNVNNFWYNSIAKCKVNGEKVVFSKEIKNIAKIYDNVEFLMSVDFSNAESLRGLDYDKIKTAIDCVFDSALLKTIAPEIIVKVVNWATIEDINSLSPELQDVFKPINEAINNDDNLQMLADEIEYLLGSEEKVIETLKHELKNIIDLAKIATDNFADVLVNIEGEIDINNILDILSANNNKVLNDIIDTIFDSEFVNLGALTGANYGLDALEDLLKEFTGTDVEIADLKLDELRQNNIRFNTNTVKSVLNMALSTFKDYSSVKGLTDDLTLIVSANDGEYFDSAVKNFGNILDSIKDSAVLNKFGTFEDIIDALEKVEFSMDDKTIKITDYVNVSCIKNNEFSFKTELNGINDAIKPLIEKQYNDKPLIMSALDEDGYKIILEQLEPEQKTKIINILNTGKLFSPLKEKVVNTMNEMISAKFDVELPEGIDLSKCTDIINDAITLLPKLEEIGNDGKTLKDVLLQDEEVQDTMVDLLEKLEKNKDFENMFDAVVDYVGDNVSEFVQEKDCDNLKELINEQYKGQDGIDWESLINDFLAK